MPYPLRSFAAASQEVLKKLQQMGIENTDHFLELASYPQKRADLSNRCDIQEKNLLNLATLSDLVRIKGVGIKLAQLLLLADTVLSVQDLVASNPKKLHEKLILLNKKHCIMQRNISLSRLTKCIEQARELEPKLLVKSPVTDNFERRVSNTFAKENAIVQQAGRFFIKIFSIFMILVFLSFAAQMYLEFLTLKQQAPVDALSNVLGRFALELIATGILTLVPTFVMIFLAFLILFKLLAWWSIRAAHSLILIMFRHPIYQYTYSLLMEHDLTLDTYALWAGNFLFAGLATLLLWSGMWQNTSEIIKMRQLQTIVYLGGTIIVLIVLLPSIWRIWKLYESGNNIGPNALQRFLLWRLVHLLGYFLIILFTLRLVLPSFLLIHATSVTRIFAPVVRVKLETARDRVIELDLFDPEDIERRNRFLKVNFEEDLAKYEFFEPDRAFLLTTVSFLSPMAIWLLLLLALGHFVIPLLFLGDLRRVLLLLVMIIIFYFSEEAIESLAPDLFLMPRGSITTILLLSFLILANTLLSDWLYQLSSDSPHLCFLCGNEVDLANNYCPNCGTKVVEP